MKKIFTIIVVALLLSCMTVNTFALEPIIPTPGDGGGSGEAGTNAEVLPPIVDNSYPLYTENYVDDNFSIQFEVQQITADTFHFRAEVTHLTVLPWYRRGNDYISISARGFSIVNSSRSGYYQFTYNGTSGEGGTNSLTNFTNSPSEDWAESTATFEIPILVERTGSVKVVYEFYAIVTYPTIPLNFNTYVTYSRDYRIGEELSSDTVTVHMSEVIPYVPGA